MIHHDVDMCKSIIVNPKNTYTFTIFQFPPDKGFGRVPKNGAKIAANHKRFYLGISMFLFDSKEIRPNMTDA